MTKWIDKYEKPKWGDIHIVQTEQWEYSAWGYGLEATGSDKSSAELALLRKAEKKYGFNKNKAALK